MLVCLGARMKWKKLLPLGVGGLDTLRYRWPAWWGGGGGVGRGSRGYVNGAAVNQHRDLSGDGGGGSGGGTPGSQVFQ